MSGSVAVAIVTALGSVTVAVIGLLGQVIVRRLGAPTNGYHSLAEQVSGLEQQVDTLRRSVVGLELAMTELSRMVRGLCSETS